MKDTWEDRFDKEVKELRNSDGDTCFFGWKGKLGDVLYTQPDWGHIKEFIEKELQTQAEDWPNHGPAYCSYCTKGIKTMQVALIDKEKRLMWHPECQGKHMKHLTKSE